MKTEHTVYTGHFLVCLIHVCCEIYASRSISAVVYKGATQGLKHHLHLQREYCPPWKRKADLVVVTTDYLRFIGYYTECTSVETQLDMFWCNPESIFLSIFLSVRLVTTLTLYFALSATKPFYYCTVAACILCRHLQSTNISLQQQLILLVVNSVLPYTDYITDWLPGGLLGQTLCYAQRGSPHVCIMLSFVKRNFIQLVQKKRIVQEPDLLSTKAENDCCLVL